MNRPKHIVAIGDIDHRDFYHVGDEAMLEANYRQLLHYAPDTQFTFVSADPAASTDFYRVPTVPRLGFAAYAKSDNYHQHLQHLLETAQHRLSGTLDQSQPFHATIEALYRADVVWISGGGNLNSTWPEHLFERIALIQIAALFDKQVIITGQTIGPELHDQERGLLAETFSQPNIGIIGVREQPSAQLLKELGIQTDKITNQLDDAFYLAPQAIQEKLAFEVEQPYIAVTLSPFVNPAVEVESLNLLAAQLQTIQQVTGASLVFIPHISRGRTTTLSDVTVADYLQTKLPLINLPVYTAREVVWLVSKAALVISSRYHPLIFAAANNVPSLGLFVDRYTQTKLVGAQAHAGLGEWALPIEAAVHGLLVEAVQELWSRRDEISRHLTAYQPYWEQTYLAHWLRLLTVLDLPQPSHVRVSTPITPPNPLSPHAPWRPSAHIIENAQQEWSGQYNNLRALFRQAEEYAHSLENALAEQRAYVLSLQPILTARESEIASFLAREQSLQEILHARALEIASLQEIIKARDVEIAALHEAWGVTQTVLHARETDLAAVQSVMKSFQAEISTLQANLAAREAELKRLQSTRIYRLKRLLDRILTSRHRG